MVQHVNTLCRSATFALSKIGKLRKYLDPVSTQKLIQAFVISRLDNCNSLLYGLSAKDIGKIQRVQNMAARLISLTKNVITLLPSYVISFIGFRLIKEFNSKSSSSHTRLSTVLPHPIWKISSPCMFLPVACGQVMYVLRAISSRLAPVLM